MRSVILLRVCTALMLLTATTAHAGVKTLTSATFSRGYGFVAGTWNTTEITAVHPAVGSNTPTTQGDFTFNPVVSGTANTSFGPRFPNRVLTDIGNPAAPSVADQAGQSANFAVSLTGTWTGSLPSEADTSDLGFRLVINITQLSIYGVNNAATSLRFNETTAGHVANGPFTAIAPFAFGAPWGESDNTTHVLWDPDDFALWDVTTFTRTFNLTTSNALNVNSDGFEILGNIQILYYVPEPASALALLLAVAWARALSRPRRPGVQWG